MISKRSLAVIKRIPFVFRPPDADEAPCLQNCENRDGQGGRKLTALVMRKLLLQRARKVRADFVGEANLDDFELVLLRHRSGAETMDNLADAAGAKIDVVPFGSNGPSRRELELAARARHPAYARSVAG